MVKSIALFLFYLFLLVGGIFMALTGVVLYQPDIDDFWFLPFAYGSFGLVMIYASCLVASHFIKGE